MRIEKFLIASICLLATGLAQAGAKIEHWTTQTGARVYFVASTALPLLDVQVDIPAGSAQDPAGKSGVAALTRGLLDAGVQAAAGEAALDEEAIAGRIVDLGIRIGGGVDYDRSSLTLRTLSDAEQRNGGLLLMRRLLSAPSFPEAVLAREKTRTIAAIQDAETRPGTVLAKRFAATLYGDHPYGRSASVESVSAIMRADIEAFHRSNYTARNAVISLLGNISRAEAERIAEELAAALPGRSPVAAVPPVTAPARAEVVRIAHPSAQAHIAIGMPSVQRSDPEYYALLVGNYTLGGGGFVSRLMQEVREKRGYAYDVHSYFAPRKLEGPFQIGLQTRREQADDALKVVHEVLKDFLHKGPSEAQLKAAKQYYIDGLPLRIDSNAKLLGYLSAIGFYELPLSYIDDYPRLIGSVTAEQVRAAFAGHVKTGQLVTVIVGAEK